MKNLLLFILIILGFQNSFGQNYTKGNVYDFNIGDEFHYRTSSIGFPSMPNGDHIDRILDRYTNSTHLFYEVGDVSLTNSNVILSTRIDSIPLSTLSDFVLDTISSGVFGDTIITKDTIITDSLLCSPEHLWLISTLDIPDGQEPPLWWNTFKIGLGDVNYYRVSLGGYASRNLVYYKKGNVRCGEPVYITSIQNIGYTGLIKLSPNPFQDRIFITSKYTIEQPIRFYLYNNLGQLILEQIIQGDNSVKIPTNISKGIYYGVIHYKNQVQTTKLVKQ